MEIVVTELEQDGVVIGHTPLVLVNGKYKGFIEKSQIVHFPTPDEAKEYGQIRVDKWQQQQKSSN